MLNLISAQKQNKGETYKTIPEKIKKKLDSEK